MPLPGRRPAPRRARSFRPGLESMEHRDLPSGMTLTSAAALTDGRTVQLTFTEPVPTSQGSPDWMPGYQNGFRLTTSNGITLEHIGDYVTAASGTLTWTATYLVDDPSAVIQFGQTGLKISAQTGLLQDNAGNYTSGFSAFPVANHSLVDATGFTTQAFTRGTGGATIYVSSTYGNDSRTFAQAQNPATPYKTLTDALNQVWINGMNGKGADIKLLRGDKFTSGGGIKTSGQDPAHPFIIEDYWYNYTGHLTDPKSRPTISIDETNSTSSDVLDTTSAGKTPATVDNVVIRQIDFEAVNWTGNIKSRYGLDFLRGGTNWTLDDCVIDNFGTGVVFQGYWGAFHDVTMLRDSILDSRYDNSVVSAHSQGLFLSGVTGIVISQCSLDNNGRVSADRSGRDLYSHNIYIKEDCGPAVVWGNIFRRGGSYGIEMRSGGVLAYNYFGRNAIASFVDGLGGTQYKNVVEKAEDISSTMPRGFGLQVISTYGESISQVVAFNIIVNTAGHQQSEAITVKQVGSNAIDYINVTHNTIVNAGQIAYKTTSNVTSILSLMNTHNILDAGSGLLYSSPALTGPLSYIAGQNVLNATASRNRVTQLGNNRLILADWSTATGGSEATSISKAPQYMNKTADIGSFYKSIGGTNSEDDYTAMVRGRGNNVWNNALSTISIFQYFAAAYQPTNLASLGSATFDFYGATDYR